MQVHCIVHTNKSAVDIETVLPFGIILLLAKYIFNRDMVIFVDYVIYAVLIFMFTVVGCQLMRVININIVDFKNIKNINLRIKLKTLTLSPVETLTVTRPHITLVGQHVVKMSCYVMSSTEQNIYNIESEIVFLFLCKFTICDSI